MDFNIELVIQWKSNPEIQNFVARTKDVFKTCMGHTGFKNIFSQNSLRESNKYETVKPISGT